MNFDIEGSRKFRSLTTMDPRNRIQRMIIIVTIAATLSFLQPHFASAASPPPSTPVSSGTWQTLHESIGISAMHMQLLPNSKVIMFDRTDFGPSNLTLPNHLCRFNDERLPRDCTAHSVIYDVDSNAFRPLMLQTDTFCSSGSLDASGVLIQTGGYHSGERSVRIFHPSNNEDSDWEEIPLYLSDRRWYSSNQILPDGRVIVVGGRGVFTYEFFPKSDSGSGKFYLKFLRETFDYPEENNLYPFLHLLPDGNLFIFANNQSVSFDYNRNRVVREFPAIPEDRRSYPCSGSSVLLPISLGAGSSGLSVFDAEVMICGGAPAGAYYSALRKKVYVAASRSCGRMRVTDPDPVWVMEKMPMPRVMSDMVLLPNGDVLMINGATNGTAGWELGRHPALKPVLYSPYEPPGQRFRILTGSGTARMYHSTAVLVPDGRVLVGGSNPHNKYDFGADPYPTELSLEAFAPPYMAEVYASVRPSILTVEAPEMTVEYGGVFAVNFMLSTYFFDAEVAVNLVAPSFATHALGMNQRMLVLELAGVLRVSPFAYRVMVFGPPTNSVAPPGYYMLFVVHFGVPSHGVWVKIR
uniref:Glyoxal oxidase n=1 Tax=Kalanchoe fedtschenkoi TaxID=63787 RepID=A0A7N0ZVY2_KALFE